MRLKKTVSDKVITANRRNAQQSTGPKDPVAVRHNALRHGLLARRIVFRNKEEETEFKQLLGELEQDPCSVVQRILLEELATCWWNLQKAERELEEIRGRRMASRELLDRFISNCGDERVSMLSGKGDETTNPECAEQLGWDCREVLLKTGTTNRDAFEGDLAETGGSSEWNCGSVAHWRRSGDIR